jgi:5-methylcytosine-specific restriction enzyme subunit McrC
VRTFTLRESQAAILPLTPAEATALQEVGRRLVGVAKPWGSEEVDSTRTVVRCEPVVEGQWRVVIDNAVGLISLGPDTQLVANPKIPTSHLLYLFAASGRFPRLDEQSGMLSKASSLWELVAEWFVSEAERTLRRDLRRDYESFHDELSELRGTLNPLLSASRYYAGRITFVCDFDDFNVDIALNRVIRAAAEMVVRSPELKPVLRRRARGILARMEDVGSLRPRDSDVEIDRCTAHYVDSLLLARHILESTGRTVDAGGLLARTFLIRTPEAVEDGLRQILVRNLSNVEVTKRGDPPPPTSISLTPDLVFDGRGAIADVKYKLAQDDWRRSDLYQVVAFATGFKVDRAAIIEFSDRLGESIPPARVGPVSIQHLAWTADDRRPEDVAAQFVADVNRWLSDPLPDQP